MSLSNGTVRPFIIFGSSSPIQARQGVVVCVGSISRCVTVIVEPYESLLGRMLGAMSTHFPFHKFVRLGRDAQQIATRISTQITDVVGVLEARR